MVHITLCDQGKTGWLDVALRHRLEKSRHIKKALSPHATEFDLAGQALKHWDLGDIINQHLQAHGDTNPTLVEDGIDWCHVNDVIYDQRDDSLIWSCRELFIIKTDYETGTIKWILGDETKYWSQYPSLLNLFITTYQSYNIPIGQHALSITQEGHLLLYSNGAKTAQGRITITSSESAFQTLLGRSETYSSIQQWHLDETNRTASLTWFYTFPFKSDTCSSTFKVGSQYVNTHSRIRNASFIKKYGIFMLDIVNKDQQQLAWFTFNYPFFKKCLLLANRAD